MIEQEVIKILELINPDVLHIAGNQDGEHPNTVFCIVEEVDSVDIGEPSRSLRSSDGSWVHNQTREYQIQVGFQGRFNSNASQLAETLKILLDNDFNLRSAFKQNGFSYYTGNSVTPMPMNKNTSRYVRYALLLTLRTNISTRINGFDLSKVEINKGVFKDSSNGVIYEYKGEVG